MSHASALMIHGSCSKHRGAYHLLVKLAGAELWIVVPRWVWGFLYWSAWF